MKKMVHIGLLMMLKNEEKRLQVTLDSLIDDEKRPKVDSIMVYDTGSEDRTLEILSDFSKTHNIPHHVKHGKFENFAASRNVALKFADHFKEVDFLLMLDCNDELRGDLRPFCDSAPKDEVAWLVHQCWWSGMMTRYYNVRLIRPRVGWRYEGVVHEYITRGNPNEMVRNRVSGVELYQDRTQDDDKTGKRFSRDKKLLIREYRRAGENRDPRTVFYLAQTCLCLHDDNNALKYYMERADMIGFYEERYHAYYISGKLLLKKGMIERGLFYLLESTKIMPRVEPLLELVRYYRDKNWWLATQYAKMAYYLDYPTDAVLFVDADQYTYERYHLLGIVAYYAGEHDIGREAILKAIEAKDRDIDKSNLSYYPPIKNTDSNEIKDD